MVVCVLHSVGEGEGDWVSGTRCTSAVSGGRWSGDNVNYVNSATCTL